MNLKPKKYTLLIFWGLISINIALTAIGIIFSIPELALIFVAQTAWFTILIEIFNINTGPEITPNLIGMLFIVTGGIGTIFLYYLLSRYLSTLFNKRRMN